MKSAKPSQLTVLTYPALCAAAYAVVEDLKAKEKRAKALALQLLAQLRAALGLEDRPGGFHPGGPLQCVDKRGQPSDTPQYLAIHRMESLPTHGDPGFWWRFVLTVEDPQAAGNRHSRSRSGFACSTEGRSRSR